MTEEQIKQYKLDVESHKKQHEAVAQIEVTIETPRWSFVKYKDDGMVDYVSPIPSPFNYGSIPSTASGDGDRTDVIVMGKRLGKGRHSSYLVGKVLFTDKGEEDTKYILSEQGLTTWDVIQLIVFFRIFVIAKTILNRIRGKKGKTKYDGVVRTTTF